MNLYDFNKNTINSFPALTDEQIAGKEQLVIDFFNNKDADYYMLLCKEQVDYTLFYDEHYANSIKEHAEDLFVCIKNRGEVLSIDLDETGGAIEIWIRIENEPFCYLFFPYDEGVIKH
jgi:hypothetical protein